MLSGLHVITAVYIRAAGSMHQNHDVHVNYRPFTFGCDIFTAAIS